MTPAIHVQRQNCWRPSSSHEVKVDCGHLLGNFRETTSRILFGLRRRVLERRWKAGRMTHRVGSGVTWDDCGHCFWHLGLAF